MVRSPTILHACRRLPARVVRRSNPRSSRMSGLREFSIRRATATGWFRDKFATGAVPIFGIATSRVRFPRQPISRSERSAILGVRISWSTQATNKAKLSSRSVLPKRSLTLASPMRSEGRTLPKATPAMARRVWEAQRRPSARTVARALTLAGRPVHFVTVARWKAQDWRPVRSDHPLEVARSQLDAVAPLVSGDPKTTLDDLIDDPTRRRDLDELTDAEVLRRAGREVAIAIALVTTAIQNRATTSDFNLLELTPALFAIGQSMHALPGAFEQAIDLQQAQHNATRPCEYDRRRDRSPLRAPLSRLSAYASCNCP
jgi:hypothetical protein